MKSSDVDVGNMQEGGQGIPKGRGELGPLSEVRVCGTPKQEIQKEMNASAQEEEEMEERGAASIQQVVLSIMARMWELFWEMGRSPTMSVWTGHGKNDVLEWGWGTFRWVFDFWQGSHWRDH
jgi:hypothetical protein